MYRGFNLTAAASDFGADVAADSVFQADSKKKLHKALDSLVDPDGNLSATKVIKDWFPEIKTDVFISHSHKDATLALRLSAWLKRNFGLSSFVDASVWGYSDELLKKIDNDHSWSDSNKKNYDYKKRNRSTTHVHLMLSTALLKMMNTSECIIFLNTQNAISTKDYISDKVTASPWLYAEIAMMQYIRKRSPEEHRGKYLTKSATLDSIANESFQMNFDVNLDHLTEINTKDLNAWVKAKKTSGASSLDSLYSLKPTREVL